MYCMNVLLLFVCLHNWPSLCIDLFHIGEEFASSAKNQLIIDDPYVQEAFVGGSE